MSLGYHDFSSRVLGDLFHLEDWSWSSNLTPILSDDSENLSWHFIAAASFGAASLSVDSVKEPLVDLDPFEPGLGHDFVASLQIKLTFCFLVNVAENFYLFVGLFEAVGIAGSHRSPLLPETFARENDG